MKTFRGSLSVLALASLVTLGISAPAQADTVYANTDGENIYDDECAGPDFKVTIDNQDYFPGDVASGFEFDAPLSIVANGDHPVWIAWAGLVQDGWGHGTAADPVPGEESLTVDTADSTADTWREFAAEAPDSFVGNPVLYPAVFLSPCDEEGKFASIQVFPGYTLEQVGYEIVGNEIDGFSVVTFDEGASATALSLEGTPMEDVAFAPLSDFRNAVYAFWAYWLTYFDYQTTPSAFAASTELAVWGYAAWGVVPGTNIVDEWANGFYTYSGGTLSESSVDDVIEDDTPSTPSASVSGDPGIFLTVTGGAGSLFEGRTVIYGSYAVAPNSPYKLTVQSISNPWRETRVLASGVVNGGGHLEATTLLPRMAADSYRIVFEGVAVNGQPLKLTNHVNVNAAGRFTSISAERLQPLLR